MWPMLLDYSREECKRILRKLELEAYSSIVTAFRAQGELTKEKKKLLQDLSSTLSISTERHRAEIRRAVNDEKLNTVAEFMGGSGTASDWAIEGRRLIPLMPRLVPQTAFSSIANSAAEATIQHNSKLPLPNTTGHKRVKTVSESSKHSSPVVNGSPSPMKAQAISSSPSNVVVLPSGMSIQIKADGTEPETPTKGKKHRKSNEPTPHRKSPQVGPGNQPSSLSSSTSASISGLTRTVSIPMGASPLKITLGSSTVQKSSTTTTTARSNSPIGLPSQKVILVSTSGTSLSPSILHKSLSIPVVKTVSATKTTVSTGHPKFAPSTVVASPLTSSSTTSASKQPTRPRTVTLPVRSKNKQNAVIPIGSNQQGSLKNVPGRPGVQIKSDAALKILNRSAPNNKMLPRTTASGTSRNASLSSSSSVSRVVSLPQGALGLTSGTDTNIYILNAKSHGGQVKLQSVTASSAIKQAVQQAIVAGGIKSNSNVIVLRQSQLFPSGTNPLANASSSLKNVIAGGSTSVKTVVSPSDQSLLKALTLTTASDQSNIKATTASSLASEVKSVGSKPNTLLADLMQATGIIYGDGAQIPGHETANQQTAVVSSEQLMFSNAQPPVSSTKDPTKHTLMNYNTASSKKDRSTPSSKANRGIRSEHPATISLTPQASKASSTQEISHSFSFDHLPEGSVFELNAPEVAGLLGQNDDLSAENTIKILKQVGFDVAGQTNYQKVVVQADAKLPKVSPAKKQSEKRAKRAQIHATIQASFPDSTAKSNELRKIDLGPMQSNEKSPDAFFEMKSRQSEVGEGQFQPSANSSSSTSDHSTFTLEAQSIVTIATPKSESQRSFESQNVISSDNQDLMTNCIEATSTTPELSGAVAETTNGFKHTITSEEHQAFLEEVVKGLEKQEQLSEHDVHQVSNEALVNVNKSEETTKILHENNNSVMPLIETKNVDNLGESDEKVQMTESVVSKPTDANQMELESFPLSEETIEQTLSCESPKKDFNDVKHVDKKSAFIRLQDLGQSKATKQLKIHQMPDAKLKMDNQQPPIAESPTTTTLCPSEESQSVSKSSVDEIVMTQLSGLEADSDQNIYVSVSIGSKLSTFDLLSQSSMNHGAVANHEINLSTLATSNLFSASHNLPLVSTEQNYAVTEVTRSVTAPMMASQVVLPKSDTHNHHVADETQNSENCQVSNSDNHAPNIFAYNGSNVEQNILPEPSSTREGSPICFKSIPIGVPFVASSVDNDVNASGGAEPKEKTVVQLAESSSYAKQLADSTFPIQTNVADASVDSTSVLKCTVEPSARVDSSTPDLASCEYSDVIDSTSSRHAASQSSDNDSNSVSLIDSLQSNSTHENRNTSNIQMSKPRICPAPANFMVSTSSNTSAGVSSSVDQPDSEAAPKNVTVEQEIIDTTNMKFEDFASQRIGSDEKMSDLSSFGPGNLVDSDVEPSISSGTGTYHSDNLQKLQLSADEMGDGAAKGKRKRKLSEVSSPGKYSGHVSSWVRSAMGLLQRVAKFRGSCRSKSDQDAAHWFISPVDVQDVPDYYNVIKQPMDFSTIKSKLENGQYANIVAFHNDMLLVKSNCETYNPPKHPARLDCEEVFAFYVSEYQKLMEKWQRSHIMTSPKRAKPS